MQYNKTISNSTNIREISDIISYLSQHKKHSRTEEIHLKLGLYCTVHHPKHYSNSPMATEALPSNSPSANQPLVVKQEQPQDACSEISGIKEVKTETTLDSTEAEPLEGCMEVKREPQDDDLEPIDEVQVSMDSEFPLLPPNVLTSVYQLQKHRSQFLINLLVLVLDLLVLGSYHPSLFFPFVLDSKEHVEKFKRYEAEFRQYLMSKYFSDKTISGGNIFDVKMNIDGHTITASRLPPYQSYLDPATFHELISKEVGPSAETPSSTSTSNGKPSN
ncbi:zinc finger C-x8-C-x5-C-x3-H type family protein [Striga asiatica]|uniref:Zinc finger C-x8-C-x5-C-x3-H type family protein n=1 Tax=Striga asiatica TaxID=4170 RepID=A0A5A7R4J7_STRAF|nr:zinc finger C-x8-C-x5-C-x3-H type family protein [Striga asiatica]